MTIVALNDMTDRPEPSIGYYSVSEAARELGAIAENISTLFYRGVFRDDLCPIIGRQRLIPADYLPMIAAELRRRGMQCREIE